MNEELVKELNDIIYMLDTTLFALKWKQQEKNNWDNDSIIRQYEFLLRKLKICCINNFGCLDD